MEYIHYIHIGKNWFYWFSEFDSNKEYRPYNGDGYVNENYTWFAGKEITKSQAKKILKEKFPDYEPILTYPYHQGGKINKHGSRPIKITINKDNYREIRNFFKGEKYVE